MRLRTCRCVNKSFGCGGCGEVIGSPRRIIRGTQTVLRSLRMIIPRRIVNFPAIADFSRISKSFRWCEIAGQGKNWN